MCGIAGIAFIGKRADTWSDLLTAMNDTLVHRGPDDGSVSIQHGVGLANRRLAVIDVEAGKQPILNEDGSIRAVFNGEIYNYRDLRRDLEERGHRLSSNSDGEILVHMWEEYGEDFPARLNGMFAIALHDTRQQKLFLVRDRLGIKPLYYYSNSQAVVFGSEIKAILRSGLVPRQLHLDALVQFIAWEYVPAPHTLFQDVAKMRPAECVTIDLSSGQKQARIWWDVLALGSGSAAQNAPRSAGEWTDAVEAKLVEAVRRQLISDVPLGAFLSGGVDSSIVVSAMDDPKTFSIGFADPSYDESGWSRRVAEHLGTEHHVETVEPRIADLFDHLMNFMEDPIGDTSIFPTYLVSKVARQHVTVALSGDGGDELFGGYEAYLADCLARKYDLFPASVWRAASSVLGFVPPQNQKKGVINKTKRFVEGMAGEPSLQHARWRMFLDQASMSRLFTPAARAEIRTERSEHIGELFERARSLPATSRNLYVDLNSYLVDNCLTKVDRMSMACSLEARVPFLDHEVVELAFTVPDALKVTSRETKPLLKQVAARRVPRACVYRKKEGFSVPVKNWLRSELRPVMDELLSPKSLGAEGVFDAEYVKSLMNQHVQGTANNSHILWAIMVFQDWRRRWRT